MDPIRTGKKIQFFLENISKKKYFEEKTYYARDLDAGDILVKNTIERPSGEKHPLTADERKLLETLQRHENLQDKVRPHAQRLYPLKSRYLAKAIVVGSGLTLLSGALIGTYFIGVLGLTLLVPVAISVGYLVWLKRCEAQTFKFSMVPFEKPHTTCRYQFSNSIAEEIRTKYSCEIPMAYFQLAEEMTYGVSENYEKKQWDHSWNSAQEFSERLHQSVCGLLFPGDSMQIYEAIRTAFDASRYSKRHAFDVEITENGLLEKSVHEPYFFHIGAVVNARDWVYIVKIGACEAFLVSPSGISCVSQENIESSAFGFDDKGLHLGGNDIKKMQEKAQASGSLLVYPGEKDGGNARISPKVVRIHLHDIPEHGKIVIGSPEIAMALGEDTFGQQVQELSATDDMRQFRDGLNELISGYNRNLLGEDTRSKHALKLVDGCVGIDPIQMATEEDDWFQTINFKNRTS